MTAIDSSRYVRIAAMLKQCSDETRLQVLMTLSDGDQNVGQLCSEFGQSQPAVSHHLALLRFGGLVETRRSGKTIIYSLSEKGRALIAAVQGIVSPCNGSQLKGQ